MIFNVLNSSRSNRDIVITVLIEIRGSYTHCWTHGNINSAGLCEPYAI